MFACDLHTHTRRSDGHLTPVESIDRAAALGLRVLGITDHDTILPLWQEEGEERIQLEEYGAKKGVTLLRGIEVSCDTKNDDVHVIGLYCNWDAPEFVRLEGQVKESRTRGYQELVRRLRRFGYDMKWEEIVAFSGKEEDPQGLQKKHIYEYMAKKGYVDSWQAGKILVQSLPEFRIEREKPDPREIIHMLHRTGGIAILAHPYLIRENPVYQGETMTRREYLDMLAEAGLDGIEACYPYDKTSYKGSLSKEEIQKELKGQFQGKRIFFSGGSDFHGDFKTGMKNPRELGECGVSWEYFQEHICRRKGGR